MFSLVLSLSTILSGKMQSILCVYFMEIKISLRFCEGEKM